jgi:hypothetical protein
MHATGQGPAGPNPIPQQVTPQYIATCTANVYSTDPAIALKATQQFRRILSIGKQSITHASFVWVEPSDSCIFMFRKESADSTCH